MIPNGALSPVEPRELKENDILLMGQPQEWHTLVKVEIYKRMTRGTPFHVVFTMGEYWGTVPFRCSNVKGFKNRFKLLQDATPNLNELKGISSKIIRRYLGEKQQTATENEKVAEYLARGAMIVEGEGDLKILRNNVGLYRITIAQNGDFDTRWVAQGDLRDSYSQNIQLKHIEIFKDKKYLSRIIPLIGMDNQSGLMAWFYGGLVSSVRFQRVAAIKKCATLIYSMEGESQEVFKKKSKMYSEDGRQWLELEEDVTNETWHQFIEENFYLTDLRYNPPKYLSTWVKCCYWAYRFAFQELEDQEFSTEDSGALGEDEDGQVVEREGPEPSDNHAVFPFGFTEIFPWSSLERSFPGFVSTTNPNTDVGDEDRYRVQFSEMFDKKTKILGRLTQKSVVREDRILFVAWKAGTYSLPKKCFKGSEGEREGEGESEDEGVDEGVDEGGGERESNESVERCGIVSPSDALYRIFKTSSFLTKAQIQNLQSYVGTRAHLRISFQLLMGDMSLRLGGAEGPSETPANGGSRASPGERGSPAGGAGGAPSSSGGSAGDGSIDRELSTGESEGESPEERVEFTVDRRMFSGLLMEGEMIQKRDKSVPVLDIKRETPENQTYGIDRTVAQYGFEDSKFIGAKQYTDNFLDYMDHLSRESKQRDGSPSLRKLFHLPEGIQVKDFEIIGSEFQIFNPNALFRTSTAHRFGSLDIHEMRPYFTMADGFAAFSIIDPAVPSNSTREYCMIEYKTLVNTSDALKRVKDPASHLQCLSNAYFFQMTTRVRVRFCLTVHISRSKDERTLFFHSMDLKDIHERRSIIAGNKEDLQRSAFVNMFLGSIAIAPSFRKSGVDRKGVLYYYDNVCMFAPDGVHHIVSPYGTEDFDATKYKTGAYPAKQRLRALFLAGRDPGEERSKDPVTGTLFFKVFGFLQAAKDAVMKGLYDGKPKIPELKKNDRMYDPISGSMIRRPQPGVAAFFFNLVKASNSMFGASWTTIRLSGPEEPEPLNNQIYFRDFVYTKEPQETAIDVDRKDRVLIVF